MKLLLIGLLAFAYSTTLECAPVEPSTLDNDLLAFDQLYSPKDLNKIFKKYRYQIYLAHEYMKSKTFASQLADAEKTMEFEGVLKYLQESKLDVYRAFNEINKQLGIDIHFPTTEERKVINGTLVDMVNDLTKLVPKEKIYAMYKTKVETSPDYANFVKRLHSSDFKDLSIKFMDNPKVKFFIKSAHNNGVPLVKFLEFNAYHWGLMFDDEDLVDEGEEEMSEDQPIATRNLQDDLESLKKLIPMKEIEEVFYDYLMNDQEFQEVLEYATSNNFTSLVKEIEAMPEVKEGLSFLEKAGLPAYDMLNKLNSQLGIDNVKPILMKREEDTSGVRGFLDKVRSMLPLDELKKWYEEKLSTSADFKALVEKLKSKESQDLVNKLMSNEKFKAFLKEAEAHKINVQEVFDLLQEVLGLKFPTKPRNVQTKNLGSDFDDFFKLLPQEEIKQLVENYMYEDEEFQEAVSYVFSEDFQTIAKFVQSTPEFEGFVTYMTEKGVPVRDFFDNLNELLDIELDSQEKIESRKIKGGLKGFIKDFKKLLPMKPLKMMFKEKMATSPDFKDFIIRMKSPETKEYVKKVMAHPKVQELITKLNDKGIKIDNPIMLL